MKKFHITKEIYLFIYLLRFAGRESQYIYLSN